jgi:N-hydroxyarylamine O-acetyltransferase
MFNLDAYLERIGLSGRPGIAQVHRGHLIPIPFEDLDPHQGQPVSLDVEDLERKLVTERRGGYCFEQNLLLKAALEALGAEVDMFLGCTRVDAKPGVVRPRSHLVLRVKENGVSWHAALGLAPAASSSRSNSGRGPRRSMRVGAFASSTMGPSSCSRCWPARSGWSVGPSRSCSPHASRSRVSRSG